MNKLEFRESTKINIKIIILNDKSKLKDKYGMTPLIKIKKHIKQFCI